MEIERRITFCSDESLLLRVNRAKPEKVVVDVRDRHRHILFTAEDNPHLLPDVRRLLLRVFTLRVSVELSEGDVLARRRDVVTMVTHPANATPVLISLSAPPGPAFT